MLELDLQAIYRETTCPALVIGGGKDLQCDSGDVFIVEALCHGSVRVKVFPDLTHLLRFDDHDAAFNRYPQLMDKPVEQEVIEMIVHWINTAQSWFVSGNPSE